MGRVTKRKVVDVVVTINYGTVNPMSWGIWVYKDNVWERVYSYYYDSRVEGKVKTDYEYADEIYRSFRKVLGFSYSDSKITFIVDPAAAGFMEELKRTSLMFVAETNVSVIPSLTPIPKMDYINRHEIVKEIRWHLSTRLISLPFDIYKTVEEYPNRTLQEIYMFVKSLFPIKQVAKKEVEETKEDTKNSSFNPYVDLTNPMVGDLIKALSQYPDDTKILFDAKRSGYFANIYPLTDHHSGFEVGVYEGQYSKLVCIILK